MIKLVPRKDMPLEETHKLRQRVEELEKSLRDFIDYFEPKGGVSQVPLGPFVRAQELLDKTLNNSQGRDK